MKSSGLILGHFFLKKVRSFCRYVWQRIVLVFWIQHMRKCNVLLQGLLNEGPKDSQCGVKGSLIMIRRFVVSKRLKLLPKY